MVQSIEMLVREADGKLQLHAPEVGYFSCSAAQGSLLAGGQLAGVIRKLGQDFSLVVPAGVQGRVVNAQPERISAPVGYGALLYELAPLADAAGSDEPSAAAELSDSGAPAYRSTQSGRFWHRPSPNDPAFVEVGSSIQAGDPIGLIEVMKTFTHLTYEPSAGLPQSGKVARILVGDGEEVTQGDVLLELEGEG